MRMSEVALEERSCDAMKVLESDGPPIPHSPAHEHNATHTQHQEHTHNTCVQEQSCTNLSNQTQVSERQGSWRMTHTHTHTLLGECNVSKLHLGLSPV